MNLNQLAVAISKREGKKVQVNIAQIKEILKITIELMTSDWGAQNAIYDSCIALMQKRIKKNIKDVGKVKLLTPKVKKRK